MMIRKGQMLNEKQKKTRRKLVDSLLCSLVLFGIGTAAAALIAYKFSYRLTDVLFIGGAIVLIIGLLLTISSDPSPAMTRRFKPKGKMNSEKTEAETAAKAEAEAEAAAKADNEKNTGADTETASEADDKESGEHNSDKKSDKKPAGTGSVFTYASGKLTTIFCGIFLILLSIICVGQ